jgi:predicted RNA-binding protein YlxR (DUF448 family)
VSRRAHVPVRLCMGCGGRAPQRELLRITSRADGTLVVARGRTPMGRSGYLHPAPACWQQFATRKGAVRSLARHVERGHRAALVQELKQLELYAMMR